MSKEGSPIDQPIDPIDPFDDESMLGERIELPGMEITADFEDRFDTSTALTDTEKHEVVTQLTDIHGIKREIDPSKINRFRKSKKAGQFLFRHKGTLITVTGGVLLTALFRARQRRGK